MNRNILFQDLEVGELQNFCVLEKATTILCLWPTIKFEGAKVASLFFLIFVIIKYGTYNCQTIQSVHIWLHEFIFQCAQHHIHHTYIPNYLPNPHIRSPGIGAAEPLLLPPLESPSPSSHGACSYIQIYISSSIAFQTNDGLGKDNSSSSLQ